MVPPETKSSQHLPTASRAVSVRPPLPSFILVRTYPGYLLVTVVVTGPSAGGIGGATLTALAKGHPQALVLAGRTPSKFQSIVDDIKKTDPNIKVVLLKLDLSSIAAARKAGEELLANPDVPHIDVLLNNAGIMGTPFEKTVDGIESQFATCHIGHFIFTNVLMPKLRAAADPVVVNVTSGGHRFGSGDFSDVNFERKAYDTWVAYGNAKCANVLFTVSLSDRGIKSVAVHPGCESLRHSSSLRKDSRGRFVKT